MRNLWRGLIGFGALPSSCTRACRECRGRDVSSALECAIHRLSTEATENGVRQMNTFADAIKYSLFGDVCGMILFRLDSILCFCGAGGCGLGRRAGHKMIFEQMLCEPESGRESDA